MAAPEGTHSYWIERTPGPRWLAPVATVTQRGTSELVNATYDRSVREGVQ